MQSSRANREDEQAGVSAPLGLLIEVCVQTYQVGFNVSGFPQLIGWVTGIDQGREQLVEVAVGLQDSILNDLRIVTDRESGGVTDGVELMEDSAFIVPQVKVGHDSLARGAILVGYRLALLHVGVFSEPSSDTEQIASREISTINCLIRCHTHWGHNSFSPSCLSALWP